jgi:uncharacterized protein
MRIELDKLEQLGGSFAHSYSPEELSLEDQSAVLRRPPKVRGRITLGGAEVDLEGEISAGVEVECDRCLKPIAVAVETSFDVRYLPVSEYRRPENHELDAQDLSLALFDGEAIDIDQLVREQILLALPVRRLCREECRGLCQICGIDRNVSDCGCEIRAPDPRWSALKALVDRKS